MNVKLQGLLNAARYVEREYGASAYERTLDRCDPEIRDRIEAGIAIEWHPMEELVEFLEKAQQVVGAGDELSRAAGAEGARQNKRGFLKRAAFWLASPQYIMNRAAQLWSQFNDSGELRILEMDEEHLRAELADIDTPSWTFCQVITGWAEEMMRAVGFHDARPQHVSCRARGDERCIILVRYSKVAVAEPSAGNA